ncbi:hypothetical protein FVP33_14100 [Lacisediminihabitans profunda]|uniref:Uncharacterized protein n=1 Tax=Lacisediminihabitans profunda TaxID=2594790 RepID=A0A5C8UP57_9MICO|nr:hypothetical protein FVP33_14100 [Lacisediminihabitans profunda]
MTDDLPSKAETTRIPRAHRRSAVGMWALAGSWSAQQLTDGHIPEHMLDELSGTSEDAAWLVTAGFWEVVEDGWQFVEWAPDQPLRAVVLAERAKRAEKMRGWRSRNQVSNPATDEGTNEATDTTTEWFTDPSVKDAQPMPPQKHVQEPALEYSAEFEEWWSLYPRKQAKPDAYKAFKTIRKTTELATLVAGVQAYKLATIGGQKGHLKMPAGWLRDRRWEDEQVVTPTAAGPAVAAPEARARQTMALAGAPVVARIESRHEALGRECEIHPGYPQSEREPCAACERTIGPPEGNQF